MAETVIRLPAGLDDASLGDLAYESASSLVETALRLEWDDERPYEFPRYMYVFADLLYTVLQYSASDEVGKARLHGVLDEVVAEPFLSAIRETLLLIKAEDIHGFLRGIKPYMLRGNENPDLWEPLLKQNRTKILMMDVDCSRFLAEEYKDILEFNFGEGSDNDVLIIDIAPLDNGGTGLIHALVFQPDFILADFSLGGLGGEDMLDYIRQHPQIRNTPYSLISARGELPSDPTLVAETYRNAKYFLSKPFENHELVSVVASHIELARANASE